VTASDATSPATDAKELVRLEIPALPAFVGVARVVVASVSTTVDGIDEDRLEDLRIAVSEACTNAVEAQTGDGQQRVVLRCVLKGDALEVHVEDDGPGFDPSDDQPAGGDGLADGAEQGWGLQLIRALVDDVDFSTAEGGTRTSVRLLLRRTTES